MRAVQQHSGSTCLKISDKTGHSSDTRLQPTHHDDKYVGHVPFSVPKIPLDDDLATVLTLLPLPTTTPIWRQPSKMQIRIDQKQPENVKYLNHLVAWWMMQYVQAKFVGRAHNMKEVGCVYLWDNSGLLFKTKVMDFSDTTLVYSIMHLMNLKHLRFITKRYFAVQSPSVPHNSSRLCYSEALQLNLEDRLNFYIYFVREFGITWRGRS
jgi:hypothetical protein